MQVSNVCRFVVSENVSGAVVGMEFRKGLLAKGTLKGLGDSRSATTEDENILCEWFPNIDWLIGVTGWLGAKGSENWIGVIKDLGEMVSTVAGKPSSWNGEEKSIVNGADCEVAK